MSDRCDKGCRRRVRVIWALWRDDLPERDWALCGVCSDADAEVLVAQGWVLVAEMEAVAHGDARVP